jgi:hypothetical protein
MPRNAFGFVFRKSIILGFLLFLAWLIGRWGSN